MMNNLINTTASIESLVDQYNALDFDSIESDRLADVLIERASTDLDDRWYVIEHTTIAID